MSARHTHLITSDNFFNDFSTLKKQLIIVAEGTVFGQVGEAQWNCRIFLGVNAHRCQKVRESGHWLCNRSTQPTSILQYKKILGNHVVLGLYEQSTAYPWLTRL